MGKGHKRSKIDKAKNRGHAFFEKWRREGSYCPYFKENILVTRLFWNHLLTSKRRTKVEKIKRLELMPLGKKLLESTTTCQNKRIKGNLHFWAFHANMDGKNLKVVVSSMGAKKQKCLLSIMEY